MIVVPNVLALKILLLTSSHLKCVSVPRRTASSGEREEQSRVLHDAGVERESSLTKLYAQL